MKKKTHDINTITIVIVAITGTVIADAVIVFYIIIGVVNFVDTAFVMVVIIVVVTPIFAEDNLTMIKCLPF